MRGAVLLLPRDSFPLLEEGEFYACDVEGARVVGPEGDVGVVEELLPYPSCDVLVVKTPSGRREIPVVDGMVESVDIASATIRVTARALFDVT